MDKPEDVWKKAMKNALVYGTGFVRFDSMGGISVVDPKDYHYLEKKEWVGLTDEEIIKCFDSVAFGQVEDDLIINKHVNIFTAIHGIEAKLKERNT